MVLNATIGLNAPENIHSAYAHRAIQPYGTLIICDNSLTNILAVAANFNEYFPNINASNAQNLSEIFNPATIHKLRNALTVAANSGRPAIKPALQFSDGREFDVTLHNNKTQTIIEIEPCDAKQDALTTTRMLMDRISQTSNQDELLHKTTRLMKALLNYDRVFICQYKNNTVGPVISEAVDPFLETYLGKELHTLGITMPTHETHRENAIRHIRNIHHQQAVLLPETTTNGEQIHLSHAHLKLHTSVEYDFLQQMNAKASLTVPVFINGHLWGAIECQHTEPMSLSMNMRSALEMFVQFFTTKLTSLMQQNNLAKQHKDRDTIHNLFSNLDVTNEDVETAIYAALTKLHSALPNNGVGFLQAPKWHSLGLNKYDVKTEGLASRLENAKRREVWSAQELDIITQQDTEQNDNASVFAIPVPINQHSWLIYIRTEGNWTTDEYHLAEVIRLKLIEQAYKTKSPSDMPQTLAQKVERKTHRDASLQFGVQCSNGPNNRNLNVLVLEDQALIAINLENILLDFGADRVETAVNIEKAISLLENFRPDIAILDINIGSETSMSFAMKLLKENIPFIFATGYADNSMIPRGMRDIPIIHKPFDEQSIIDAVNMLIAKRSVPLQ